MDNRDRQNPLKEHILSVISESALRIHLVYLGINFLLMASSLEDRLLSFVISLNVATSFWPLRYLVCVHFEIQPEDLRLTFHCIW